MSGKATFRAVWKHALWRAKRIIRAGRGGLEQVAPSTPFVPAVLRGFARACDFYLVSTGLGAD
eukprot:8567857-Pyramimonas_sp.AAC.1